MNIMPVTYIISAYQSGLSEQNNLKEHERLKLVLIKLDIPFKVVQGCYNNETELSFVILGIKDDLALSLAESFNQESVLKLHSDRFAELIYSDGRIEPLGQFAPTNRDNALKSSAYTYDQTTNTYYIVS